MSAWTKPLTSFTGEVRGRRLSPSCRRAAPADLSPPAVSFQGVKPGSEVAGELAMESIQFGAPSSAGSTDSDGAPALPEVVSENKLPAPKEQRPKQPRAGPIKAQKVGGGGGSPGGFLPVQ